MNLEDDLTSPLNKSPCNSEGKVFNAFAFLQILSKDHNNPDINFCNDKNDIVDSPYSSLVFLPWKVETLLENHFLYFKLILEV